MLALSAVVLVGCKEDDPQDDDNNNNTANEATYNGQTRTLTEAHFEEYGAVDNQFNVDLTIADGNVDNGSATAAVYFEVKTDDSVRVAPGTYAYDVNWGDNTFDLGVLLWVNGSDTNQYAANAGTLTINSSSSTSVDCSFTMTVVNVNDPADNGTVSGSYSGGATASIKTDLNSVLGVKKND